MTFEPLLEVTGLSKRFPVDRHNYIGAVNDVSFVIGKGETLGLVGESGSGKTTVGRCILRLTEPTSGSISFDGMDLTDLPHRQLRVIRPHLQLVFQDPLASLNPRRTVWQTVSEPLRLHAQESAHLQARQGHGDHLACRPGRTASRSLSRRTDRQRATARWHCTERSSRSLPW